MERPQSEEEVRSLLMQLEIGKKQMQEAQKQAQMIESAIVELSQTIEAIEAVKSQKIGDEILVQLGSGSFIRAKISDVDTVLVGIGAGLSVEKSSEDAGKTMQKRKQDLQKALTQTNKGIGELALQVADLNKKAEEIMGSMQQGIQ